MMFSKIGWKPSMNKNTPTPEKTTKKTSSVEDHAGHRLRLKRRFLQHGMNDFEPHQVLEMILFFVIPQRDTNPLAHRLIQRFGSLAGVFDATVEELMSVDGIGSNAATYIKMFPAVFRRYELSRDYKRNCFDTLEKVGNYAKKLFIGATVEQAYLLMFNNRLQLIGTWQISDGTVNSAPILPRMVVEHALDAHASSVVLTHNHPYGSILASREDIEITHIVESACTLVGVNFLDHLIVAGNDFCSILRSQKGYNRASPLTGKPDSSFYRNFYKERR